MRTDRESIAQRLLAAAQSDEGLQLRLRNCHRGAFDALDALWWRVNPGRPNRDGVPDPALEIAALKSVVYSRAAASAPLQEFVDPTTGQSVWSTAEEMRLRLLTVEMAEVAAALDLTLDRLSRWAALGSAKSAVSEAADGVDLPAAGLGAASGATATATVAKETAPPRHGRRGTRGTLLAFSVVAAIGFWPLGPGADGAAGPERGLSPGPTATAQVTGVPAPTGTVSRRGLADSQPSDPTRSTFLRIFESSAVSPAAVSTGSSAIRPDGGFPSLGPEYRPESIRSVAESVPLAANFRVYAAERTDGRFCLVERDVEGSSSAACGTMGDIARRGLRLRAVASPPRLYDLNVDLFPSGRVLARAVSHGSYSVPSASPCAAVRRAPCEGTLTRWPGLPRLDLLFGGG